MSGAVETLKLPDYLIGRLLSCSPLWMEKAIETLANRFCISQPMVYWIGNVRLSDEVEFSGYPYLIYSLTIESRSFPLHETFMRLALAESKKALPGCLPNPPVGCVLVRDGVVVSAGYTKAPGEHHAEASALAGYDGPLSDLTVYVTLEPCSFQGRTPSCAVALIDCQVSRVVVALVDPDSRNNGRGLRMLRQAGIDVVEGVGAVEVGQFLNPHLIG